MEEKITKVAVGIIIFKDNKVLLIKRKNSIGAGDYAFPGGKLDYMEGFEDCARREVLEETGIIIKNINFINVSNTTFFNMHFVLLGYTAEWESGEEMIMEPEKCDSIGWYDIDNLPQPLFAPSELILEAYKNRDIDYDKK